MKTSDLIKQQQKDWNLAYKVNVLMRSLREKEKANRQPA